MKIADVLNPAAIVEELLAAEKAEALAELADALSRVEKGLDRDDLLRGLQEREMLGSTGIGHGVAIPHCKLKDVQRIMLSFGRSRRGVAFDSMDGEPAHLFFLLVAPPEAAGDHLKILARVSKLLKHPDLRQRLLDAAGSEAIVSIISQAEDELC